MLQKTITYRLFRSSNVQHYQQSVEYRTYGQNKVCGTKLMVALSSVPRSMASGHTFTRIAANKLTNYQLLFKCRELHKKAGMIDMCVEDPIDSLLQLDLRTQWPALVRSSLPRIPCSLCTDVSKFCRYGETVKPM